MQLGPSWYDIEVDLFQSLKIFCQNRHVATEPIFLHLMHHYLLEKQKPSLRYSSFELYCPFFPFLEHNVVVHSAEEYYYFQLIFHEDLDSQHLAHIYLESKVNICLSESILVILRWV